MSRNLKNLESLPFTVQWTVRVWKPWKTLERGFYNTHHFRKIYSSLSENSFVISSPSPLPLSYHERRFYPNTTHTHSKCRECFRAWEALGLCQNKLMKLGGVIERYCGIQKASKDKILWSSFVVEAWRAQVFWVD